MEKFRREGDMFVMYDDDNNQKYSFLVQGKNILRFFNCGSKLPERIELPNVNGEEIFKHEYIDGVQHIYMSKKELSEYAMGNVRICDGCFWGFVGEINIDVPYTNSIVIDPVAFNYNADVKFNLPKDMDIKMVRKRFNLMPESEAENRTIILDKHTNARFGVEGYTYTIKDYDARKYQSIYPKYTVIHKEEESEMGK